MIIIIQVVFVLLFINFSKCETQIQGNPIYNYTSLNGDKIANITEYCKYRRCITKCCPGGKTFTFNRENREFYCKAFTNTGNGTSIIINSKDVTIYKRDIEKEIAESKLTVENFTFVNNDKFASKLYTEKPGERNFYVLEDASLMIEAPNYYNRWAKHLDAPADYCLDLVIVKKRGETNTFIRRIRFGRILDHDTSSPLNKKSIYIAVAMLISSFFLLLVLIVYGLLPKLRNIVGMVLMAYVVNLLVWFTMKATHILLSFNGDTCNIISKYLSIILAFFILGIPRNCAKWKFRGPIMYFTILASFFWLNIMSFDIWWTFRGTRKCRDIHRRGELVKFLWYCLYAWGTPMAVTISIVILDRTENVRADIVKPHFSTCLYGAHENMLFTYIPIIILTVINCVLFLLTIYNIWLIHRGMRKFNEKDSQKNKNNENRFFIYIKMSVLMGVSWILEIVQSFAGIDEAWLYILVNTYNAFLGVAIFFFFVFKKSIFIMLCKSLMRQDERDDEECTYQGASSLAHRRGHTATTSGHVPTNERSASFTFTRGSDQLHLKNSYITRMESNMSSRNTGDSTKKQLSRTESETTDTMVELKDANNMTEISLNPKSTNL